MATNGIGNSRKTFGGEDAITIDLNTSFTAHIAGIPEADRMSVFNHPDPIRSGPESLVKIRGILPSHDEWTCECPKNGGPDYSDNYYVRVTLKVQGLPKPHQLRAFQAVLRRILGEIYPEARLVPPSQGRAEHITIEVSGTAGATFLSPVA
ncbi:MAG: hypothetical protein WAX89_01885 [Alphaproteobacteria bacterium]